MIKIKLEMEVMGRGRWEFFLFLLSVLALLILSGCKKKSAEKIIPIQEGKSCPAFFKDADGDGYTDGTTQVSCISLPGYVESATAGDCDDDNPNINPAKAEICDGIDNNCNGQVDEGLLKTFYKDNDGDGYGNSNDSVQACYQPIQYVLNADDCDDNNNLINPNTMWFKDADGDGFTDGATRVSCLQPAGYVLIAFQGDCDDSNPLRNPNIIWFKDADGDGFTDGTIMLSCVQPAGFIQSALGGDCDDSDPIINPGQPEICDGKDNNCNGEIDERVKLTFYKDQDGDGYGNPNESIQDCSQPTGYVQNPYDCNDSNRSIYPGAPLNCNNGQDNDCSGNIEKWAYTDQDGDRYAPNNVSSCVDVVSFPGKITAGQELGYNDCNDTNASIHPGAPLNCNNGQDNDCSGNIEKWAYTDQDGDRYAPNNVSSCVDVVNFPGRITVGYELGYNDCNDNNASINPSALDNTCDSIDNNCNLYVDENTAPCFAPTSFGIYSWGLTYVSLSWTYPEPSSNVEKFVIQRSPNGITYVDVAEVPASATNYTIRTYLTSKYYFRVYAKNATGSGSPSSVTSAPIGVNSLFEKTIGGSADNQAFSIIQSSDGGYAVAGYISSFGAGGWDFYVVKLDSSGNVIWTKTIGGSSHDVARSIIQSSDGGYAIAGYTIDTVSWDSDIYIVKLDSAGNVEWTETIGGDSWDVANSIIQSSDGGYVVAGYTQSFGASGRDIYIVKLDSAGNVEWTETIGGDSWDVANSIIQSSDGGYVVAGYTQSFGASGYNMYVVKLDSSGNVQWTKTIGRVAWDFAWSITQSSDGEYIVAGESGGDFYVVKLDSAGNVVWTKTIGGSGGDVAHSIIQSSDGGYVVAGYTSSFGAGYYDIYVVKLDSSGNVEWTKTIGGSSNDLAYSIIQSSDGGYVVAGYTQSFGAGNEDIYVVKLAPDGTLGCHDSFQSPSISSGGTDSFQTPSSSYVSPSSSFVSPVSYSLAATDIALCLTFGVIIGGGSSDLAFSIIQSSDGGYVVAGRTWSFGAGYADFYVVKLAESGGIAWSRTIGGSLRDIAYSIVQSSDGGYIVAGETWSFGAGYADFYVVKLDNKRNVEWTKTIGGSSTDVARSIIRSSDGGYVVAGWTNSFGAGNYDMFVVKLDSDGSTQWTKTIGGSYYDIAYSIVQSSDGGYVVAGATSYGGTILDFYVVKLYSDGSTQWARNIGGSSADVAHSIIQSSDGGYVVAGRTRSFGAGYDDFYVVKLDSEGNVMWTKTIGGSLTDIAYSIVQSSDGGYVVAGYTQSFGAGNYDIYVVKLDSEGNVMWTKTIGGSSWDVAWSIIQSSDELYIVAGETWNFGTAGSNDFYVLSLDPGGGDTCFSQTITSYIVSSPSPISSTTGNYSKSIAQNPTTYPIFPTVGVGGTWKNVCSAGSSGLAPHVNMCLISESCEQDGKYYPETREDSSADELIRTENGEGKEIRTYGCSVGGFVYPLIIIIFIIGWIRFRKMIKLASILILLLSLLFLNSCRGGKKSERVDTSSFLLQVSLNGEGTVTSEPAGISCSSYNQENCQETFTYGKQVILTAEPAPGWMFASWEGCDSVSGNRCVITMDRDKSVRARFRIQQLTLTVIKDGNGNVISNPAGIDCGGDCSENYNWGSVITLAANPSLGWIFDSWEGCDSVSGDRCVITMDRDKSVRARFRIQQLTLTVIKDGNGNVISNPAGIDCGGDCSENYSWGSVITLAANPSLGWIFDSWEGCDSVSGDRCVITMDRDKSVRARFRIQQLTLTVIKDGNGNVISNPAGIDCGGDCSENYNWGSVITLAANPSLGWIFDSWEGCDSVSGDRCVITMDRDKSVRARFRIQQLTLTVIKDGNGNVISNPAGIDCGGDCSENYNWGSVITLAANPSLGWIFDSWEGCDSVSGDRCVITMDRDKSVRARFRIQQLTLTVIKDGNGNVISNPAGIDCGGDCSENYNWGSVITLAANPSLGWIFDSWEGCDSVSGDRCVITMDRDKSVRARFRIQQLTLTVIKDGNGNVISNPAGIDCGGDCSENYNWGSVVTLTVSPEAGWFFDSWGGDEDCADGRVVMDSNKICIAKFNLPFIPAAAILYGRIATDTGRPNYCYPITEAAKFALLDLSMFLWERGDLLCYDPPTTRPIQKIRELNPNSWILLYRMLPAFLQGYDRNISDPVGGRPYLEALSRTHGIGSDDRWFAIGHYYGDYLINPSLSGKPMAMELGNSNWRRYWIERVWEDIWGTNPIVEAQGASGLFIDVAAPEPYNNYTGFCTFTTYHFSSGATCVYDCVDTYYTSAYGCYGNAALYFEHLKSFIAESVTWYASRNLKLIFNPYELKPAYAEFLTQVGNMAPDIAGKFGAMEELGFTGYGGFALPPHAWLKRLNYLRSATNFVIFSTNNIGGDVIHPNCFRKSFDECMNSIVSSEYGLRAWDVLWFAMTSFLLGYDPRRQNGFFHFTMWAYRDTYWVDEYDPKYLHLGWPLGDAYEVETRVWIREFEDGWVVVNINNYTVWEVLVPRGRARVLNHDNFKTPSNAPLVESFAIRPYRGVILLKEGARGWRGQR